jgi:cell pole-organizing protein PopZ
MSTSTVPTAYVPAAIVDAARSALKVTGSLSSYVKAEGKAKAGQSLAILAEYQNTGATMREIGTACGLSAATVANRLITGAMLARLGGEATQDMAATVARLQRPLCPKVDDLAALLSSSDATGEAWAAHVVALAEDKAKATRAAHVKAKTEEKAAAEAAAAEGTNGRTGTTGETPEANDAPAPTLADLVRATTRALTLAAHDDSTVLTAADRRALEGMVREATVLLGGSQVVAKVKATPATV